MEDKKKDLNIFFHDKKLEGYPLVISRQPFLVSLYIGRTLFCLEIYDDNSNLNPPKLDTYSYITQISRITLECSLPVTSAISKEVILSFEFIVSPTFVISFIILFLNF